MKKKLFLLIIIPLLISTGIAITIAAVTIQKEGINDLEKKSLAILRRMEAVRTFVANQGFLSELINNATEKHPDGNLSNEEINKIKNSVPIIASWKVGMENAQLDNYEFRIATPENVARNKKNIATDKELEFINEFKTTKQEIITYTNEAENQLWVMKPVYIRESEGCLVCHGTPQNSPYGNGKDVLGYNMESMKDGEFRGIFVIKSDLSPVQASTDKAIFYIGVWGVILVLISGLIGAVYINGFVNSFTNKFNQISDIVKLIANGNLTKEVAINTNDELKIVKDSINGMIQKIKEVISVVMNAAEQISFTSQEVCESSRKMLEGTTNQATSVGEISSSMEEMATHISQNTDNAKETEISAISSAKSIQESSNSVNQTVASMVTITDKISIIGEISRQTNLLALNAAVEAARAGEFGKGFAVVASEIRKLAERSQSAASQIDEVSKSSVDIAQKSGIMLDNVVPEVQKNANLVRKITTASIEQTNGANLIHEAIQQLNQVVQENGNLSKKMTFSSEELNLQADTLKESISFFKVSE